MASFSVLLYNKTTFRSIIRVTYLRYNEDTYDSKIDEIKFKIEKNLAQLYACYREALFSWKDNMEMTFSEVKTRKNGWKLENCKFSNYSKRKFSMPSGLELATLCSGSSYFSINETWQDHWNFITFLPIFQQ